MAAPLNFPYGCRDKRGSELGQRNGNPRLRTYVRLQTGIFLLADADGYECRTDLS